MVTSGVFFDLHYFHLMLQLSVVTYISPFLCQEDHKHLVFHSMQNSVTF